MTVTMDRAGRLVVPKAIRDEAGLLPGAPLRIWIQDGRIEIEPRTARFRSVMRKGFRVAESIEPLTPMSTAELRRTIRDVRDGRIR